MCWELRSIPTGWYLRFMSGRPNLERKMVISFYSVSMKRGLICLSIILLLKYIILAEYFSCHEQAYGVACSVTR